MDVLGTALGTEDRSVSNLLLRRKEVCTLLVNTEVLCLSVLVYFGDKMTFKGFTFGATQGSSTAQYLPFLLYFTQKTHIFQSKILL